ncbi:uncharacterized protein LOC111261209 isoform X2 [Varroa jacobsoni]|uniref:uncharacterized protein LOC111261209 isoform X2 n=1 Tax=Varroa jacobsoni TaxID=62625 RepID=UPI000BF62F74|nr:uncharacterized protein LOC111261209 isoform X2 [Varroa jacobsoni]
MCSSLSLLVVANGSQACNSAGGTSKPSQVLFVQTILVLIISMIAGAIQSGCDTDAVDNCLAGVLFSAQDNRSYFWKDVSDIENLCKQVPNVPQCVKKATEDCTYGAKKFLDSFLKGFEVILRSQICSDTLEGVRKRKQFVNSSSCLRAKFDNGCMKSYIDALDKIVTLPSSADKIRKACCLHRSYRVCLADHVTPICGVEAASNYIQFNSMLSAAPIRQVCGIAYAEDTCSNITLGQHQNPVYAAMTPNVTNANGTILSRLLKILVDTAHTEQPTIDFDLDEALEYTTCTAESIDECFENVLLTTKVNSSSPWGFSSLAHINGFCARLQRIPRCLRSRTSMCHTVTNEFFKLVKEEMELTAKSSFCQKGSRRDFFIESGRCVFEQVDNNCTIQMARALQAATKAPVGEARRKLICCVGTRVRQLEFPSALGSTEVITAISWCQANIITCWRENQ